MSFILDALRKSEAERQRQDAPGIASIPHGGNTRSSPRWMWLAVALLLVNLAVLGGVLVKMNDSDAPATAAAVPSTTEPVAPLPAAPAQSAPTEIASPGAGTVPATVSIDAPAALEPSAAPVETANQSASTASTTNNRTSNDAPGSEFVTGNTAPAPAPQSTGQVLASFNELRASGALNLPDLHLDIHVYSGQPDERFVFVNMAKYRENATLSEGPVVREITPEGVILDYRGTDFLLPRE